MLAEDGNQGSRRLYPQQNTLFLTDVSRLWYGLNGLDGHYTLARPHQTPRELSTCPTLKHPMLLPLDLK
jgi:hypothetical protein